MEWKVIVFTFIFIFNLFFSNFSDGANILIAMPFYGKSHYLNVGPIGLELARRGHNVTSISAFRENDPLPNYREIFIDAPAIFALMGASRPNKTDFYQLSDIAQQDTYASIGIPYNEAVLSTKTIQSFLKEDQHFDVVIVEQFYNEVFNMLAHKYNCPLVLVSSFGNCMKQNVIMGNPLQLISLYSEYISVNDFTSVWSRLKNVYNTFREYYKWVTQYLIKQEQYAKKYLNPLTKGMNYRNEFRNNHMSTAKEMPTLYDVQKSVSLFLINRHFSFDTPAAYLPNIVEIGGVHLITDGFDANLPQDLQKILDESKHGVIYVSFGTVAQVSDLSWTKRNNLIEIFRNLNQTVLWKCDVDIENLPTNVVIRKWFSQKHILAHPNVKLFISHGGLIGVQEAVFNGVPILGVPLFGDQTRNTLQAQLHGIGRILAFEDLDIMDTVAQAVSEIVNDSNMRKNAANLANKFKDRPREALDTAVLRIEKVIQNNGFVDFGIPLSDISWIEYYLLDVLGIICLAIFMVLCVIVAIIKRLLNTFLMKDVFKIRRKKL